MIETLAIGFLYFVGLTGFLNPVLLYLRRRAFNRILQDQLSGIEFAPLREALASETPNPVPLARIVISLTVAIVYLASLWTALNG